MPPTSTDLPQATSLFDASAAGFAATNRLALAVLSNLCDSECVEGPTACDPDNAAKVRREVYFCMERLGYTGEGEAAPKNDREILEALRTVLHIEAKDLSMTFLLRALCQTNPQTALLEMENALRWARLAALSPL